MSRSCLIQKPMLLLIMLLVIGLARPTILSANELIAAAAAGDANKVAQLIEQGEDVNAKNEFGFTALRLAFTRGHNDVVKLLLDANADQDGMTELMWAAGYGKTEVVKQLLAAKVDVNESDNLGFTALIWAARTGYTEVVKLLLAAKAEVDERALPLAD